MKNFIPILKETLRGGYKRDFYFWLFALFSFAFSISFFIIETKQFLALLESQERLNDSFMKLQPQILRLQERLKRIDWKRDYSKKTIFLSLTLDLGNLPKTLKELHDLTKGEDTYLLIEYMTYSLAKDQLPALLLKGMIIKFN